MDRPPAKKNLPRLGREAYQGLAVVHWVFNIQDRKTGWLDERFFRDFEFYALHTFARYQLLSPCVCLMPDHIHLLVMGYANESDQKVAIPFLRKSLKPILEPFRLQRTPYDHVLRVEERKRREFARLAGYIRENPVRAGLVKTHQVWPYQTAIVPGYPTLDVKQDDFWDDFWNVYHYLLDKHVVAT